MASNRPNKHKRQRQNRQEREARRARSERAGEATALTRGEREAPAATAGARTTTKAGKGVKAEGKGRRRESPYKIPGQRAVVMAFMFTIVSAVTLLVAPVQVTREVDADSPVLERIDEGDITDRDEKAGTVTYVEDAKLVDEEGPAVAAGVLLTPIIITGIAVLYTKKPQRATVWTMAMVGLAAFVFLFAGPYGIITLPSMIALAVGGFQTRRADSKVRMAELKAEKAARRGADDGEVIDVDAVEEAPVEERGGDAVVDEDRR